MIMWFWLKIMLMYRFTRINWFRSMIDWFRCMIDWFRTVHWFWAMNRFWTINWLWCVNRCSVTRCVLMFTDSVIERRRIRVFIFIVDFTTLDRRLLDVSSMVIETVIRVEVEISYFSSSAKNCGSSERC